MPFELNRVSRQLLVPLRYEKQILSPDRVAALTTTPLILTSNLNNNEFPLLQFVSIEKTGAAVFSGGGVTLVIDSFVGGVSGVVVTPVFANVLGIATPGKAIYATNFTSIYGTETNTPYSSTWRLRASGGTISGGDAPVIVESCWFSALKNIKL